MCDVVFFTPNMGDELLQAPIGTMQLATILGNHGISCQIIPLNLAGASNSFEAFLSGATELLQVNQPAIVSFYTRCDAYHIELKLAEHIKKTFPEIYIVLGGPQSDITAEETIRQLPYVDYICCGEGENTIYPFFSSLLNGNPDTAVPGLVYRSANNVVKNPRPTLIDNLDSLPPIDYSYIHRSQIDDIDVGRGFPVDVGRGCPFGCTYCSTKNFWGRKYRLKSPERIIEDIKTAHERFGVTLFRFTHDMFTLNRSSVMRTCELMHTLDFPIHWSCSARLDCIDPSLIDIMADAGMTHIFIGIETGSPRMQKLINKNLKLSNAVNIMSYLKEKNINITASFMYGFPEETEEDLSQTLMLVRELLALRTVFVQMHLCTFLAGTELSDRYISQMTPVKQYSDITGQFAIDECRSLIDGHPELFPHMLEYTTEMRTKLKYFPIFVYIWHRMQPVYHYLSEKYSNDHLINMYFDFVAANKIVLDELSNQSAVDILTNGLDKLIAEDNFPKLFADDTNYDLIRDFFRLYNTENSEAVRNGDDVTQVFSFKPNERNKKASLQDYDRCVAVVNWSKGKRKTIAYPLPSKPEG